MGPFIGFGTMSTRPRPRKLESAARSGSVTCVEPTNADGSQTSASVGATLKSPQIATGVPVAISAPIAVFSAASHSSLYS